jgi:hypothetical protein
MEICRQGRIRREAGWARRDRGSNPVQDLSERKVKVQVSLKAGVEDPREEDDIFVNAK